MKYNFLKPASIIMAAISLLIVSCEKSPDKLPVNPVPINLTLKQASLVTSENSFAFDIFKEVLSASPESENIIISPLSISYALSMTVNGAENETRDAMLNALRVNNLTPADLNQSYKDLTAALLAVDKRVLINIANSVWTENNFVVKKPFTDILTNYYTADARSFDINDATAPDKINKWIEDHTNGLIKNMVDRLNDNTVMLLVNAIYFKGKWKLQFDKSVTSSRSFTKSDGSSAVVQAMHQTETHKVYMGNGFVLAEIPYGQGNYVMDIILPDENTFSSVSPVLTAENFSSWTNALSGHKVNLYLPRFKYDYNKKLKEILSIMGMGIAFGDNADFSNISDLDLLINEVTHQAFIETNEEGTEAAAATIVDVGVTSAGPDDPILIDVNHPFIYFIRETTTNSILFMGRVTNPLAE